MSSPIVGRFAPSPSGRMHLGNLFTYLLAWLSARAQGGRVVLRIEDLDRGRCRPEYAALFIRDLKTLGLDWDEGPGAGGTHGPYYQSERDGIYASVLSELTRRGLTYPCFCTRAELHAASAPHASDGTMLYPGTCRYLTASVIKARLAAGKRAAVRLKAPDETYAFCDGHLGPYEENLARESGDFLLRRSDGLFAYQLAVVVDDAAMGVTEVVRGADLLSSTPRQLYLYRLLGAQPPRFCHVPLLLAPDGRRLAKRDRDAGLDSLLARMSPEELIGRVAYLAGIHPGGEPCRPKDLIRDFDWALVPKENLTVPEMLTETH